MDRLGIDRRGLLLGTVPSALVRESRPHCEGGTPRDSRQDAGATPFELQKLQCAIDSGQGSLLA
jgi:hypothetical protein